MRRQRIPLPVDPLVFLGRMAEGIVDSLATIAYNIIDGMPLTKDLDEDEKLALAYALAADLVVSPLPSPLDAPLDAAVQERLRELLPGMNKYHRMIAKAVEAVPVLELLPTYTMIALAAIREKEVGQ